MTAIEHENRDESKVSPTEARRRGRAYAIAATVIACTFIGVSPAHADMARRLDEHRFVPSALVRWGFIQNEISATSSAGFVDFELLPGESALVPGGRDGRFTNVAQTFAGAAAVTPWLGVSLRVTAAGVIPRDATSAFFIGTIESYGAEGGVLLRLIRTEHLQITARADGGLNLNRSVVLARLPGKIYDEGDFQTVRPSLIVALALTPGIGVQASGSFAWRWLDIEAHDTVRTLSGALALTFALAPIPVTFIVGGEVSRDYGRDLDTVTTRVLLGGDGTIGRAEAGIYYQGRDDLDLGAVVQGEFDGDDNKRFLANLRIGYYF